MNTANLLRLILLAAIWGGSFLFMRISAPVLGPAVLIVWGALIGAAWSRQRIGPRSALGILCTGIGYIIYFRLIEEVGPTSALTVTFLNPLFGILWGVLFLGETIGWYTVAGAAIVIAGTALVIGIMPRFGARPVPAAAPANP